MLPVGSTQDLAFVRSRGAHQPLVVHAGDDVRKLSVAVFIPDLRVKRFKTWGQDDRPNLDFDFLRCLIEIDGLTLTDSLANAAFLFFKVKAAFINIRDQGNGLSEVDMDGFILRYLLIELIRVFDRTVFDAGRAARALALDDVPGLSNQGYLEVPCFPCDTVNFGIRQDFYVWMPADLDQFGCEYSDGAVVGRKGLVELGHMAANGRRLVDQVDLETSRGKIERGLDTADPSTDHHDISKITVCQIFTELFHLFFFQFRSPQMGIFQQPSNYFLENFRNVPDLQGFAVLQG